MLLCTLYHYICFILCVVDNHDFLIKLWFLKIVVLSLLCYIYIVRIININILCAFERNYNIHRNKEWVNIDFNGDGIVVSTA